MAKAPWRFDPRSSLLTLLVVGAGLGGYRALAPKPPKPRTREERIADDLQRIAALKVGYEGQVTNPTGRSVAAGRTRAAYEEIAQAEDEGDEIDVQTIMATDRGVRIPSKTGAMLEGKDPFGIVKLKFTGGDLAGEEAWTSGEYFR